MATDDKGLDVALSALSNGVATEEDDRWARRVASRLSTFAPVSRREVDPLVAPPFPDDFVDEETLELTDGSGGHDAAFAADGVGASGGWEGSMSDDLPRGPSSGLAGLAGLTRSGPPSSVISDRGLGAAKGEDSGLIDLRAVNAQAEVANDGAEPASSAPAPASSRPETAGPPVSGPISAPSRSAVKSGPGEPAIAAAPPSAITPPSALHPASSVVASSTSAAANSVPASTTSEKKKGAGIWIALGGLAAAAAVAFAVLPSMTKQDAPASTAAAPKADEADKTVAVEKPAPTVAVAPTAAASATAEPIPEPAATVAAGGGVAKPSAPGAAPLVGSKKGAEPTPTAAPAPSAAPTSDPIKKPAGGSLDDVLGIGKDQPIQKAAPTDNLPDKPDAMDVRSAINSKLGAAHACVKGLEAPSNVSITFSPAGTVSAVVVTGGPAKGTGAESCIKNAFSGAKVPPSKKGAPGSAVVAP